MQWWIMHSKTRDNYIYEGNTFQGHVEVPGGLIMWNLTEEVFGALGSVLMSGVSKLVSLSVAVNDVSDAGAKHIWEALRHCKLQHLEWVKSSHTCPQ